MKHAILSAMLGVAALCLSTSALKAADPWVVYQGKEGPGLGKHIVLVSGDEEYRSEEGLPQLGKILAVRHGFKCTVLFAINPKDGTIDPMNLNNIPGLEALRSADLMIIATRFRDLPDEQMRHVAEYLDAGKPVIGLRTATHAFSIPEGKKYSKFSFNSKQWDGGFGRQILGETWINHHGHHAVESTRGVIVDDLKSSPLVRGCEDIWGPTDVYTVRLPLSGDARPVVLGQVLVGMKPTDKPLVDKKNDPMMPVAWTKTYRGAGGQTGRVFTTTMGASVDLASEGLRRLLVNAAYWCVGMEDKIPARADVRLVGEYRPTFYGYGKFQKGVKPSDLALGPDWSAIPQSQVLSKASQVTLGGPWGEAYSRGVRRLGEDPYRSLVYLRSDLTFEMKRSFTNFSGDVSGRMLEIGSLTSPAGEPQPPLLGELLKTVASYQQADGHFGHKVDWSKPVDDQPDCRDPGKAVRTPIFWGNSRFLMGLIEAHAAFKDPKLLDAAKKLGDFYINTADRLLDPNREAVFKATGTNSTGYITCYFPAIEGLVRLYQATQDERYLHQAEGMAEFFKRFDHLPLDHSHGNLLAYHGVMLLYEATGKPEYLARSIARWEEAMKSGYVWLTGGVGEKFHLCSTNDEGCSEADWLRLNLDLWRATGQTRFLDAAERLLANHYTVNRMPNGGYGHHWFICDGEGPVAMETRAVEAVWCCTFHGLLGMKTLQGHVLVGTDRGVFVNFPVDAAAPVACGNTTSTVKVKRLPGIDGEVACRVSVDPSGAAPRALFIRRPAWAEGVVVTDGKGQPIQVRVTTQAGYLPLPVRSDAEGGVTVTFTFAPRVEDRRLTSLALDPTKVTRHRGVVLADGPNVLAASCDKPRPTIVLSVDKEGRLQLPKSQAGVRQAATVASPDAAEEQARQAIAKPGTLALGPWAKMDRTRPTALVFDLIVLPSEAK